MAASSASVPTPNFLPDLGSPSESPCKTAGFHQSNLPGSLLRTASEAAKSSADASAADADARARMKSALSTEYEAAKCPLSTSDKTFPASSFELASTARLIQTSPANRAASAARAPKLCPPIRICMKAARASTSTRFIASGAKVTSSIIGTMKADDTSCSRGLAFSSRCKAFCMAPLPLSDAGTPKPWARDDSDTSFMARTCRRNSSVGCCLATASQYPFRSSVFFSSSTR